MISSVEEMSCMTAHLFYCEPEKNEFWRKTFKFTLIAEKLLCALPLTSSRYGYSWKILYINRHGKHVRERLPSRLQKIYCKEYVLSKFLLPTSLWDSSTITKWTSGRFLIAPRKNISAHTAAAKHIQYISGKRGRFSRMPGLSSSTAFNARESASSIWSLMILWRGQITKTQPFDETKSTDVMIANTWNTRLHPKPVATTANTSFSLRRLFIAMSCSFLRWISLEDFEDKNEMALCRRDALPAIALAMLRMLSNQWGLFWQMSNELTNQQFTFTFWTLNTERRMRSLQALPLLTSYEALMCRPRAIFNERAWLQAIF